jgi:HK97 family phage prohead protease
MSVREIAREDLARVAPFVTRDGPADGMGDGMDGSTLDGYGAVFNQETLIDSWEGQFREVIAPGAFKKSLRERTPRMQFDHGHHPLIGSIPIGTFDAGYPVEDPQGLRVVGHLIDNWLIQPVRDAIAAGAIDGMSFRFSVVRDMWMMPDGKKLTDPEAILEYLWHPPADGLLLRTLLELKMSEVGPVVWPAYAGTTATMREGTIDLGRLNEPATRFMLARAVLMADAADGQQGTTITARPHPSVALPADHALRAPASSQGTPGAHGVSTTPPGLRGEISRWLTSRQGVIAEAQRRRL